MNTQLSFLPENESYPEGFDYYPDFLTRAQEKKLLAKIREVEFSSFEMHGVEAKRKIAHYGLRYSFQKRTNSDAQPVPDWLKDYQAAAEEIIKDKVIQVLITHYPPMAGIGWHRDAPPFKSLFGISLLGDCRWQMRKGEVRNWKKFELWLPPRSAYSVQGSARWEWEHHIPEVKSERYSITFRSLI